MKKCLGGIDLGGSFIKAGLLSPDGDWLGSFKIPTKAGEGASTVRTNLVIVADMLHKLARKKGLKMTGLGIGSPGTIRYPEGIVTDSSPNIPNWKGTNISRIFKKLDLPVKVDNDANCMALAEYLFGAGKGTKSGFYLTIGTGIGGAVVINQSLVRGASFAAGEFGHTIFKFDGKKYHTGRRGCLEGYTAAPALVRTVREMLKSEGKSVLRKERSAITPLIIFKAFKNNDPIAVVAVEENARMIGTAIGSVVNLLNPEIVVIGGGISGGGRKYIDLIKKHVLLFAFESATSVLKIKTALFGNDAGWIGAACLNMEKAGD